MENEVLESLRTLRRRWLPYFAGDAPRLSIHAWRGPESSFLRETYGGQDVEADTLTTKVFRRPDGIRDFWVFTRRIGRLESAQVLLNALRDSSWSLHVPNDEVREALARGLATRAIPVNRFHLVQRGTRKRVEAVFEEVISDTALGPYAGFGRQEVLESLRSAEDDIWIMRRLLSPVWFDEFFTLSLSFDEYYGALFTLIPRQPSLLAVMIENSSSRPVTVNEITMRRLGETGAWLGFADSTNTALVSFSFPQEVLRPGERILVPLRLRFTDPFASRRLDSAPTVPDHPETESQVMRPSVPPRNSSQVGIVLDFKCDSAEWVGQADPLRRITAEANVIRQAFDRQIPKSDVADLWLGNAFRPVAMRVNGSTRAIREYDPRKVVAYMGHEAGGDACDGQGYEISRPRYFY